ncbi:DUF2510 domain-containing protein [Agromyces sp. NPDC058136]|uniref:DUF2510 domain-containing protein n=1 Tax=Agromyces sp. NPDC058136 TaxID=3346354 RepID=UPI0036D974B9
MTDPAPQQATPTPAGWYLDPDDTARLRWWDGTAWTDQRQAPQPTKRGGTGHIIWASVIYALAVLQLLNGVVGYAMGRPGAWGPAVFAIAAAGVATWLLLAGLKLRRQ